MLSTQKSSSGRSNRLSAHESYANPHNTATYSGGKNLPSGKAKQSVKKKAQQRVNEDRRQSLLPYLSVSFALQVEICGVYIYYISLSQYDGSVLPQVTISQFVKALKRSCRGAMLCIPKRLRHRGWTRRTVPLLTYPESLALKGTRLRY